MLANGDNAGPDFKGLKSFKGDLLHSARWDDKVDYKNKKVAIIGIGSSGIQITPRIQKGEAANLR